MLKFEEYRRVNRDIEKCLNCDDVFGLEFKLWFMKLKTNKADYMDEVRACFHMGFLTHDDVVDIGQNCELLLQDIRERVINKQIEKIGDFEYCVLYWMSRGDSREEAERFVKEYQE